MFGRSNADRRAWTTDSVYYDRVSKLLFPILYGMTAVTYIALLLFPLLNIGSTGGTQFKVITCLSFTLLVGLAHAGYVVLTAILIALVSWGFIAISAYFYYGSLMGSQNILFAMVIMLAFVLVGQKLGGLITAMTVAWLIFLHLSLGTNSAAELTALCVTVVAIVVSVTILSVAESTLRKALQASLHATSELTAEITRRRQVEDDLRQSNQRFELIVNNLEAVFWLADQNTLIPSYVSPGYRNVIEASADFHDEASHFSKRVHPDDALFVSETLANARETGATQTDMEFRIITLSGNVKWLWERTWMLDDPVSKKPILAGISIDITERVEQQQALIQSRELLQLVINNIPAHISYVDRDGYVRFINRDGVTKENARIQTLYQPENYITLKPYLDKAFAGEEQLFFHQSRRDDGDVRDLQLHYLPYRVGNDVKGIFTLSWDKTEELKTQRALQQTQKLESLGLLASSIAHDFNNLLVSILGQASLTRFKVGSDHPASDHADKALSAAKQASKLTSQLLSYSGRGPSEIRPMNINTLIEQNLHLVETAIDKQITLVTQLAPAINAIEADPAQMQQVVMNLIINAAQAITEHKVGSEITVTTELQTLDASTTFASVSGETLPDGDYVSIRVADDGIGMSSATIDSIFDPFFSTKKTGTGLGLASVLGIVRGHGGGIHVDSTVGVGTTFHMLFPASDSIILGVEPEDTVASDHETDSCVLIIDDEKAVGESVVDMLEVDGIDAVLCTTGRMGINYFKRNVADIGLVLVDMSMPEMNGHEVFQELLAIDPEVRVVFMSGYTKQQVTDELDQQPVGFIQKPFDFKSLIQNVNEYLNPIS